MLGKSRFLVIMAVLAGLAGCSIAQSDDGERPANLPDFLTVATASVGSIVDIVPAVGRIRPATQVEVGVQVSGRLASVEVDFDQPVREGDVLAVIDPAPFQAAVDRSRAALDAAIATKAEIEAQRAGVASALARHEALAARGTVPLSRVEELGFEAQRLDASFDRASAGVELARSALEEASIALSHTVVRSPIDGFVLDRRVEPGQTVNSVMSAPVLFVIAADLSHVVIEAEVAEADVGRIREGMDVRIRVDAYPREVFRGLAGPVRRAASIENRFVTYPVLIEAEDPEQWLLPGMTASIEFVAAEAYGEIIVPREAFTVSLPSGFEPSAEIAAHIRGYYGLNEDDDILPRYRGAVMGALFGQARSGGMRNVFVWTGAAVEARQVRAGAEDTQNFAVIAGDLAEGDLVVVDARDPAFD